MSILVVGSVALDTVETPFGRAERVLGGSATFFSAAASLFAPVEVVAVVGEDYPWDDLAFLEERGVDLSGIERAEGESFFWEGKYAFDLNSRDTVETRLGVFADFEPTIPERFRDAELVFLGNIDPRLQMRVLDQVNAPRLVVCDTMNFWMEPPHRDHLEKLLSRIDIYMINDSEARQLSGEHNLVKAARWIRERGPRYLVVKKGEHGAILFGPDEEIFFIPGYPLDDVFDPTGAGDSFAGGFIGYLAEVGSLDPSHIRRAMVFGSVTGSFAVEKFSVERLRTLTRDEIAHRARSFRQMTTFELDAAERVVSRETEAGGEEG